MKKIKAETPTSKDEPTDKAKGGCFLALTGMVSVAAIIYAIYVLATL